MVRIIIIGLAVLSVSACSLGGPEERRGATKTTEAQLPGSPELYTQTEFEETSAEITRYDEESERSAESKDEPRHASK